MLNAERGRWDFLELKAVAYEAYREYNPDMVLIESQASGTPLTHEPPHDGYPCCELSPQSRERQDDRVHSASPVFESGLVWAPDFLFAEEVIEECASFPFGEHDDYVDSMTQAVLRFRQGNFISLHSDEVEEEVYRKKISYYKKGPRPWLVKRKK